MIILFAASDNLIKLTGLTDNTTNALISDATVTYSLFFTGSTDEGDPVPGAEDITMPAVGGQAGAYRGDCDAGIVTPALSYYAVITATKSGYSLVQTEAVVVQ